MGKLSRNKGARFEREIVKELRDIFGEDGVKRGFQSRGGGKEQADVVCPLVHIECKVGARPNIIAAYEQAKADAQPDLIPVAVTKWDRGATLVTMSFEHFKEMLGAAWGKSEREDVASPQEGDEKGSAPA